MSKILAISEANAIAFHSMAVIARSELAINAVELSKIINASKHHVSKVMQRLVKEGLLGSTRGPSGGFYLTKKPEQIKLIEILEAIEGEVSVNDCPIDNISCPFGSCLMGGICYDLGEKLLDYIKKTTLQDIINNIEKNKNFSDKS
jgi:Rrf2 family protein